MLPQLDNEKWQNIWPSVLDSAREHSREDVVFLSFFKEDYEVEARDYTYVSDIMIGCFANGKWLYVEKYTYDMHIANQRHRGGVTYLWDSSREGLIARIRSSGCGAAFSLDFDH